MKTETLSERNMLAKSEHLYVKSEHANNTEIAIEDKRPPKEARQYRDEMGFMACKNGIPVMYTSSDIHRGRVAPTEGRRLMVRLCYSDYIKPKNAVLLRR